MVRRFRRAHSLAGVRPISSGSWRGPAQKVSSGNGRVVGRQDRVRHLRLGGPLHEEAGAERRELLGEALVVEQHLLHGDGAVRAGVAGPVQPSRQAGSAVCSAVLAATTRRTSPGRAAEDAQADGAAPVLDDQGQVGEADAADELGHPVDVGLDRVRRTGHRLVGAAEADQVGGHGAQALLGQAGHDRAVEVATRWAGRAAAARSRRRPAPRRRSACAARRAAWRSAGRRDSRAGRRSAPRVSARPPRRS